MLYIYHLLNDLNISLLFLQRFIFPCLASLIACIVDLLIVASSTCRIICVMGFVLLS